MKIVTTLVFFLVPRTASLVIQGLYLYIYINIFINTLISNLHIKVFIFSIVKHVLNNHMPPIIYIGAAMTHE